MSLLVRLDPLFVPGIVLHPPNQAAASIRCRFVGFSEVFYCRHPFLSMSPGGVVAPPLLCQFWSGTAQPTLTYYSVSRVSLVFQGRTEGRDTPGSRRPGMGQTERGS